MWHMTTPACLLDDDGLSCGVSKSAPFISLFVSYFFCTTDFEPPDSRVILTMISIITR